MRTQIWLATVVTVLLPTVASAQATGVSHPENISITAAPDAAPAPGVYEATPAIVLTPRVVEPGEPVYRPTPPSAALQVRPVEAAAPAAPPVVARAEAKPAIEAKPVDVDSLIAGDPIPLSHQTSEDIDANVVTHVAGRSNELPAGTTMKVRMRTGITTRGTVEGSAFTAELAEPALRDGRVLLPAGSILSGKVTEIHGGKRISGPAAIHLQPMAVTLPDGTRYKLYAQVIDTGSYDRTRVDHEGTIQGSDHARGTAAVMGLAAGSGIAAGAMIAGVPGAVVGGLVGAGIATVVWLKHDRQTEVPAGTLVVFQLNSALVVGAE